MLRRRLTPILQKRRRSTRPSYARALRAAGQATARNLMRSHGLSHSFSLIGPSIATLVQFTAFTLRHRVTVERPSPSKAGLTLGEVGPAFVSSASSDGEVSRWLGTQGIPHSIRRQKSHRRARYRVWQSRQHPELPKGSADRFLCCICATARYILLPIRLSQRS